MLADLRQILLEEWNAIPHPVCDQAGDQHEEENV